ncbi:MAG TPA: HU family DNA-binding protein [Candidatus Alistipes avicola]|uniref:HU family DNA-binding protein n=1 Tax=Candidatus Alistipes avicola TaxID=2838432 RepID=A0A9D2L2H7_9BACT|nr:HU family DNA-binding protein [uncultured Alistipes sp.]HJA98646.1 HU family DNA-binding protein [Candidatus Alistipes avicola]
MQYLKDGCKLLMQQKRETNKRCLVNRVVEKTGVAEKVVSTVVDSFLDTIIEMLHDDVRVRIRNFGQWYVVDYPERLVYSPKEGRPVLIAPHRRAVFKPGAQLHMVLSSTPEDVTE